MAQINIEALLAADPDIVIGSESDMAAVEKNTGLATLRISTAPVHESLDQTRAEIRFFGTVFGKEDRAEKYVAYLDSTLSRIRTAVAGTPPEKRPRVFLGFNADHLTTYGGNTFMDEWTEAAGCVNAAGEISGLGGREGGLITLSMEQVLNWNPDIVILDSGNPEDLANDPSWSNLNAVLNNRVYRLPSGFFIWNRDSCEAAVLFPEWLAMHAYPEAMGNAGIGAEIGRFYSEIFGFGLSGADIDAILNPSETANAR